MTVVKGKLQVFSSHVFAIGLIGDGRQYGDGMGLETTVDQTLIRGLVTARPLFVLGLSLSSFGHGLLACHIVAHGNFPPWPHPVSALPIKAGVNLARAEPVTLAAPAPGRCLSR